MSNAPTPGIEFTCSGCGRTLKVDRSAAGRQAKCPQCGSIQQVPAASIPQPISPPAPMQQQPFPMTPQPGVVPNMPVQQQPMPQAPAFGAPAIPMPGQMAPPHPMMQQVPVQPAPPAAAAANQRPLTSLKDAMDPSSEYPGEDTETKQLFHRITSELAKLFIGQDELVLGSLVALFSSGHVLIESVPGLGKTLFVRTLGKILGCDFGRIQFTADLMPSDITGAPIFDMKTQEFAFRQGPVFTQFLLADEINRSPAKTHAALLEIMQEWRVTVDGTSHDLNRPFLVLATQNPVDSEGTYNLPEAQLDRFMFKLVANYPKVEEEAEILRLHSQQIDINQRLNDEVERITTAEEIMAVTRENSNVRVDDKLIDYINQIVRLTRHWPQFHMGASPRAGIGLVQGSRTLAAFCGRDYAVPDDVVQIALPTLRHRIILNAEAEVEGHNVDDLLVELIRSVEVPRI